jgi:hypothetical protein
MRSPNEERGFIQELSLDVCRGVGLGERTQGVKRAADGGTAGVLGGSPESV